MVAPSSLQQKKTASSQIEHREAERESHREEPRCRHTAAGNAKKRKSGAESSARMFAADSPSTSGRLEEQQERSKARKGHEIDVLFAAQPTKVGLLVVFVCFWLIQSACKVQFADAASLPLQVPAAPKQSAPKHSASKRTDKAAGSKDDLFGNRPAKARCHPCSPSTVHASKGLLLICQAEANT